MRSFSLILLCAVLGLAVAAPTFELLAEHEVMDNFAFSFRVALKPQNMDTLESLFNEISNPKSPFYGQFLNNEEIADLISLPEEDIVAVENYLTAKSGEFCNVYVTRSLHRDFLYVDTCAAQAQLIMPNLKLSVYQAGEHKILRSAITMDIKHNLYLLGVPAAVHQYINSIDEVTDMPVLANPEFNPVNTSWLSTDKELTVNDMISYFDISYDSFDSTTLSADDGQVKAAVLEFGGAAFSPSELASFQDKYSIPSNPIRKVVGTEETFEESIEASLDVQTLTALAQNVQVWSFVFGNQLDFITVADTLLATEQVPKVISISYGEPETLFGQSKVESNNTALMKLGLSGLTVFSAAGDSGPLLNPSACSEFDATFPGASPYVVSVGGTSIIESSGIESTWIHGSGGFSVYNTRPSYQDSFVESYLSKASLPTNSNGAKYNNANRAYPDVAAFGAFEPVLADGSYQPIGGTSGACPQFAAVIVLVNIHRYQNGLGPLGALTQALYSLENGVGQDVTNGMNYATSRYGCSGQYLPGFPAIEGYDTATGLGSPNFNTLIAGLGDLQSGSGGKRRHHHKKHHKREFLPVD